MKLLNLYPGLNPLFRRTKNKRDQGRYFDDLQAPFRRPIECQFGAPLNVTCMVIETRQHTPLVADLTDINKADDNCDYHILITALGVAVCSSSSSLYSKNRACPPAQTASLMAVLSLHASAFPASAMLMLLRCQGDRPG